MFPGASAVPLSLGSEAASEVTEGGPRGASEVLSYVFRFATNRLCDLGEAFWLWASVSPSVPGEEFGQVLRPLDLKALM